MDNLNQPVAIRLAVPADAPEMAEVGMRSWEAAYKDIIPADFIRQKNATRPEHFKKSITHENKYTYVIQRGGKTVGIMHVAPSSDMDLDDSFYELHYIYLHPDYFRQGIGTKALDFAFDLARKLGKTAMSVWVLAENVNSIKFYEKCGFIADGSVKPREYGRVLECIRMRKTL